TLRPWDRSSPHNQFHRRNRFAWASRTFAGPSWLLVGDAGFFGDPVYSVGTGIATNQAIRAAAMLKRDDWETTGWKRFDGKTLEPCVARAGTMKMVWRHPAAAPLTMLVALRTAGDRFYQAAGPFGLSYRTEAGAGDGIDEQGRALFAAFARRLMEMQAPILRIL